MRDHALLSPSVSQALTASKAVRRGGGGRGRRKRTRRWLCATLQPEAQGRLARASTHKFAHHPVRKPHGPLRTASADRSTKQRDHSPQVDRSMSTRAGAASVSTHGAIGRGHEVRSRPASVVASSRVSATRSQRFVLDHGAGDGQPASPLDHPLPPGAPLELHRALGRGSRPLPHRRELATASPPLCGPSATSSASASSDPEPGPGFEHSAYRIQRVVPSGPASRCSTATVARSAGVSRAAANPADCAAVTI